MSPLFEAQFKLIDSYVNCPTCPGRQLLARRGYRPPAPGAFDEFSLRGRLWEFLYAMAGLRQFVRYTDHISDRELYTWLYQSWLPGQVDDLPPGVPVNSEVDVSESIGDPDDPLAWMSDLEEDADAKLDPDLEEPPKRPARPRFDRDRWLPVVPEIRWGRKGSDEEGEVEVESGPTDEELDAMPRLLDSMAGQGLVFPPPAELSGNSFTAKLWELLYELDRRGQMVTRTDHLSDAELYACLWSADFRGPVEPPKARPSLGFRFDALDQMGDSERRIWLRYYATADEWTAFARDHPDRQLPPRETPLCRRDWRLPWCPP